MKRVIQVMQVIGPILIWGGLIWLFHEFVWLRLSQSWRLWINVALTVFFARLIILWLRRRADMSSGKVAALIASVLTVALWQWEQSLPDLPPVDQIIGFFNLTALRFKLFHEGPVPILILWVFLFGVVSLLLDFGHLPYCPSEGTWNHFSNCVTSASIADVT